MEDPPPAEAAPPVRSAKGKIANLAATLNPILFRPGQVPPSFERKESKSTELSHLTLSRPSIKKSRKRTISTSKPIFVHTWTPNDSKISEEKHDDAPKVISTLQAEDASYMIQTPDTLEGEYLPNSFGSFRGPLQMQAESPQKDQSKSPQKDQSSNSVDQPKETNSVEDPEHPHPTEQTPIEQTPPSANNEQTDSETSAPLVATTDEQVPTETLVAQSMSSVVSSSLDQDVISESDASKGEVQENPVLPSDSKNESKADETKESTHLESSDAIEPEPLKEKVNIIQDESPPKDAPLEQSELQTEQTSAREETGENLANTKVVDSTHVEAHAEVDESLAVPKKVENVEVGTGQVTESTAEESRDVQLEKEELQGSSEKEISPETREDQKVEESDVGTPEKSTEKRDEIKISLEEIKKGDQYENIEVALEKKEVDAGVPEKTEQHTSNEVMTQSEPTREEKETEVQPEEIKKEEPKEEPKEELKKGEPKEELKKEEPKEEPKEKPKIEEPSEELKKEESKEHNEVGIREEDSKQKVGSEISEAKELELEKPRGSTTEAKQNLEETVNPKNERVIKEDPKKEGVEFRDLNKSENSQPSSLPDTNQKTETTEKKENQAIEADSTEKPKAETVEQHTINYQARVKDVSKVKVPPPPKDNGQTKDDLSPLNVNPAKRLQQRYLKRESIIQVTNEEKVQGPRSEEKQLLFKVVLIGDAGVGKTNFLSRYTLNQFHVKSKSTIGVEFGAKQLTMGDGQRIKVNIWDTAGQEQYRSITRSYYRKAHGGLILFDYTNPKTLQSVNEWISSIKEHSSGNLELVIVGNKIDLLAKMKNETGTQCVSDEAAQKVAEDNQLDVIRSSALTGENVGAAFERLVELIYEKCAQDGAREDSTVGLGDEDEDHLPEPPKEGVRKKKCCG